MNKREDSSPMGDFTLFGFTTQPKEVLESRWMAQLGIIPDEIGFGASGTLFLYTSYGEVAESDEAVVIKLGFLREANAAPVSADRLLRKPFLSHADVNTHSISGNGLVIRFEKDAPVFSAFKTILGIPQLYYCVSEKGVLCSDRLAILVKFMEHVALNEEAIPLHFLFRSTPGETTYYQNIKRLPPGYTLLWENGHLTSKLVVDFDGTDPLPQFRSDKDLEGCIYESLQNVVGDYLQQTDPAGRNIANLLSGGVDSSLIQFLINQQTSCHPVHSYSFAVQSSGFNQEIEYARQASEVFQTDHTFVNFSPTDYRGLLTRTIEALGQPPILQTEPSMCAIAEYAQANNLPARYFFSGQGADTVFGLSYDKKLKGLQWMKGIPGIVAILEGAGSVIRPMHSASRILMKGARILAGANDADDFLSPANSIAMYGNLDLLRRCFGDRVLQNALSQRREYALQYQKTDHYLEKVHLIDLMTDTYELGIQRQQLFLSKKREQLHPFFDDDLLQTAYAISPDRRYIKGFRPKYLLKDILSQQTASEVSRKPKGFSVFENDLNQWMKSGPLREVIDGIERPGFISQADFDLQKENPDFFLWGLLTFHIFQSVWF